MTTNNNDKPVLQPQDSAVPFVIVDLEADLPDLNDAEVLPFELTTLYWTPENKGEEKRVYFDCFKERLMPALEKEREPEVIKCAFFYEKTDEGLVTLCNASKRLISALEGNFVQRGTALLITYNGKKKNNTNSFMSDNWSVKPLVPRGQLIAEKIASDVATNGNQEEMSMPERDTAGKSETPKQGPGF